jgi:hypothetical protein
MLSNSRKIKNFERETDNSSARKRITAEEAAAYVLNKGSPGRESQSSGSKMSARAESISNKLHNKPILS